MSHLAKIIVMFLTSVFGSKRKTDSKLLVQSRKKKFKKMFVCLCKLFFLLLGRHNNIFRKNVIVATDFISELQCEW